MSCGVKCRNGYRFPILRPLVVGFTEASIGHGGAGALYVRVRKAR